MKKYYLMAPGPTPVPSNVLLAMAKAARALTARRRKAA